MKDRVLSLLHWEVVAALVAVSVIVVGINALLRGQWTQTRQRLMVDEFTKLGKAFLFGLVCSGVRLLAQRNHTPDGLITALGLYELVLWAVFGLRVSRVAVFEWLFAQSAREGVPALLVDLVTVVASLMMLTGVIHYVFLVELTSLVATSAVASVVLGLAMQDTLGHLFAGVSLQLDRPFRLGDWIEVRVGGEKVAGQVVEVSWRATLLMSMGEELITIPNKLVAQGLVSNFSARERPFVRGYTFRLAFGAPIEEVKTMLVETALATKGVLADPAPVAVVIETTESWITIKAFCFIREYGDQLTIGDAFQTRALAQLEARGIALASSRLTVDATGSRAQSDAA